MRLILDQVAGFPMGGGRTLHAGDVLRESEGAHTVVSLVTLKGDVEDDGVYVVLLENVDSHTCWTVTLDELQTALHSGDMVYDG